MINQLTLVFQKFCTQSTLPGLKRFKKEIEDEFVVFPVGQLNKIYAFIESIQGYPTRVALADSLKNMFIMLINHIIGSGKVNILHEKTGKRYSLIYPNVFTFFNIKRLVLVKHKMYVIPYKKQTKPRKYKHLNESLTYGYNSFNLYEIENCSYENEYDDIEYPIYILNR